MHLITKEKRKLEELIVSLLRIVWKGSWAPIKEQSGEHKRFLSLSHWPSNCVLLDGWPMRKKLFVKFTGLGAYILRLTRKSWSSIVWKRIRWKHLIDLQISFHLSSKHMIRRSASSISCRRIPILSIIGIIKKKINLPMIGLESSLQTGNAFLTGWSSPWNTSCH